MSSNEAAYQAMKLAQADARASGLAWQQAASRIQTDDAYCASLVSRVKAGERA